LQDVPSDRVAGSIFVTDGQVHDIPESVKELGFDAPIHALITGRKDEKDRRIVIVSAPKFGVVGENHEIIFRVDETGFAQSGLPLDVTILFDGKVESTEEVIAGEEVSYVFDVPHGGKNIIELLVEIEDDEITDINNEYLKRGQLDVQVMGRGMAWLDTGTHDSLLEAAHYIQTLEKRQGLKVACPEEIAWMLDWITTEQVRMLAKPLMKSGYGEYLVSMLDYGK